MLRKTYGFALIDLVFVCGVIGIISAIALPRLAMAKQAAGSASAIFATNASGQIYEHTSSLLAIMPEVGKPAAGQPVR
jgi:type II secretory pathway pseudopilin PulG